MRIAVAGGTGVIGRLVVQAARNAEHDVVVISRRTGVDVLDEHALRRALRGADSVIDVTSTPAMSTGEAVRFFGTSTQNLLTAGRSVGVQHHVALSIIGALRTNANYYAGKAAQERMLMSQPGGYSLLRASQFHQFAAQLALRMGRGPVQLAPKMKIQPVAGSEVAAELVALAEGQPQGVVADLAGPREEDLPRMIKAYLKATGRSRLVLRVPLPGPMGRAMRDGTLLPGPDARLGTLTFADWLASQ